MYPVINSFSVASRGPVGECDVPQHPLEASLEKGRLLMSMAGLFCYFFFFPFSLVLPHGGVNKAVKSLLQLGSSDDTPGTTSELRNSVEGGVVLSLSCCQGWFSQHALADWMESSVGIIPDYLLLSNFCGRLRRTAGALGKTPKSGERFVWVAFQSCYVRIIRLRLIQVLIFSYLPCNVQSNTFLICISFNGKAHAPPART